MRLCLTTYVLVALSVASFLCGPARGTESLQIESSDAPELLPYSFVVEHSNDWGVRKKPVGNQVQVLKPQRGPFDTAFYVHAFNSDLNRDDPAVFSLEMFTPAQVVDWDPLRLTLTNFGFYHDSASGAKGIVGGGYRNDSAFAVVGVPGSDQYDFIFLATGVDHTGDGQWEGGVAYLLTEDYDYDGHDEVFLWVGPGRDLEPRVLFCLEPDTRRIEWSLPVAGAISTPNFHSCRDSAHPAVILATYNLKNGVADDNFDDNFCWLARLNNRGEIVHQRIISEEHGGKGIWPGERDGLFYVFHALPMVLAGDSGSLPPQRYQLSRMDSDFHLIRSVDVADRIVSAWWDDYGFDDAHCFHTLSCRGVVRIFDTALQLLAESNETILHRFVDTIRLEGQDRPAYLCRAGGGMAVYTHQFQQLGSIGETFARFHPLVLDNQGNITHFAATRGNLDQVFVIKRRSFSDYARILFWEYRDFVLGSLALLILALVTLNVLRQRSVRQLALSEERLRDFFENSQDAFYRTDEEGRFIWGSPAVAQILGYASTDIMVGNPVADFYADPEKRQSLLEQLNETGKVTDYEAELRRHDGSLVIVSSNSAFYRNSRGRVAGVEGVFRDITERKRAEQALRESEEFNRAVIERSPIGVSVRDRTGRLMACNDAWQEIWKMSDDDIRRDQTARERPKIEFDDRDSYLGQWMPDVRRVYEEGGYLHIPEIKARDAQKRQHLWVSQHFYAIKDAQSKVERVVILTDDITDRKRAEQIAHRSQEQMRAQFKGIPLPTYIWQKRDDDFVLVDYNDAAVEITQGHIVDYHGRTLRKMYSDNPQIIDAFDHCWKNKTGTVREMDYHFQSTGQTRVLSVKYAFIPPDLILVHTDDITERRRANEALRESEERFRTIAEAAPIPLSITQLRTGEIVFANASLEQALGYPHNHLIGMKPELFYDDPRDREKILRLIKATGTATNQEIRGRRADGSMFWALVTLRRVMFNSEPALFGVFNDITEHKEAQRRLQEADRERYNQVKQIAGGVAHEIYNALFPATSSLAKLSQRLESSSPDDIERNRRLLMLAESAVGRAIGMTDLITRYSRLDSEKRVEPVVLRPLLDEVIEARSDRISNLGVEVALHVSGEHVVECRPDHLHSLLSNLLVNSLDALEEVSSRLIDVSAVGDSKYIRIQFADTGPGVAQQHRSRIFDPFYSTKPTRGTGLGLAIVKRIVEMYGGRIELGCPVDKGTFFVIFLKSVQPDSDQGDDYNDKSG